MKVLGIRFCTVSKKGKELSDFLKDGLGLPTLFGDGTDSESESKEFRGNVFPAGTSWIEVWPEGPEMPEGIMLQIVVDNADKWAEQAKANGLTPYGPTDAHGERIYYLQAPTGLAISFQSKLARE
ncbi:hypothetical protein IIC38_02005 [candidate division KSB1 bacterium]|nr:hypothetical protein [candidate division KSB1 bacterium]